MRNSVIALIAMLSLCVLHPLSAWADGDSPATLADAPAIKAAGFALLASTDSGGHTIYRTTGQAKSVDDVIASLADPLAKIFDAKPAFAGGFADAKTKKTGGCTFTAQLHGKPVKGAVFAGVNDAGVGSASVVFGPTDLSKDEMKQLIAALPAKPKMTRHDFPDNSGSVDLPDGWTTKTQSLADFPLAISGPAGQTIVQGLHAGIETPNGRLATTVLQTYQTKLRIYNMLVQRSNGRPVDPGLNPGPPPDVTKACPFAIFCDYCKTPQEMIQKLDPVLNQKSQEKGGPTFEVQKIYDIESLPPQLGGNAFGVYVLTGRHEGDKITPIRSLQRVEIMPPDAYFGRWGFWMNNLSAPDATFNQDILVMMDIVNSIQVNGQVVSQKIADRGNAALKTIQQIGESNRKMMDANHKAYMAEQQDEFDRNQSAIATQEQAVHNSSSDMIEYSLGVRDVYDSATGKMGQVDLFNSHAITQGLNDAANDPSRFVEIPLREER
jgi:hypothetical protein